VQHSEKKKKFQQKKSNEEMRVIQQTECGVTSLIVRKRRRIGLLERGERYQDTPATESEDINVLSIWLVQVKKKMVKRERSE